MKIFFATWLADWNNGELLTKKEQPNRLLSFYWIKEHGATQPEFRKYIRTGEVRLGQSKKFKKD